MAFYANCANSWSQVFNFKLACFVTDNSKCMSFKQPHLELKGFVPLTKVCQKKTELMSFKHLVVLSTQKILLSPREKR